MASARTLDAKKGLRYGEFFQAGRLLAAHCILRFECSTEKPMSIVLNRSFRCYFWTLALLGFFLDQGSKYWVFAKLDQKPPNMQNDGDQEWAIIPDVFYFAVNYTEAPAADGTWRSPLRTISSDRMPKVNHGALWGIGGRDETGNDFNHLFALISIAAAALMILWSFREATANDRWLCIALGLILAGTLGNLYDRIVFQGVRDFLQWVYLYHWPRFNIADSCLVVGAGLLMVQAFFAAPATDCTPAASSVVEHDAVCSQVITPAPQTEAAEA